MLEIYVGHGLGHHIEKHLFEPLSEMPWSDDVQLTFATSEHHQRQYVSSILEMKTLDLQEIKTTGTVNSASSAVRSRVTPSSDSGADQQAIKNPSNGNGLPSSRSQSHASKASHEHNEFHAKNGKGHLEKIASEAGSKKGTETLGFDAKAYPSLEDQERAHLWSVPPSASHPIHYHDSEKVDPKEQFKRGVDVFVAEISRPSTTLGIELAYAHLFGARIICLYQEGVEPAEAIVKMADRVVAYPNHQSLGSIAKKNIDEILKEPPKILFDQKMRARR